jgi:membrane protein DedA with SNARE-associated domain
MRARAFFRHNEAARRWTGVPPMAETLFQTLSLFFSHYGLWVVFFGVMLENAGVPVPGETVLLFAGFLAYRGDVDLWWAIVIGMAGASLGDTLGYLVGRFAGKPFVEKYVRRFSLLSRQFGRAEKEFRRHGHWAVFVGRFITGLRVFAGPLAGMFRMAYPRFLFFNFTGAMIWATTIVSVGFIFGGSWESLLRFVERLHWLTLAAIGVCAVVAAVFYFIRRRRRAKARRPPQDSSQR